MELNSQIKLITSIANMESKMALKHKARNKIFQAKIKWNRKEKERKERGKKKRER